MEGVDGSFAQQSSICIYPALSVADKKTPRNAAGKGIHFGASATFPYLGTPPPTSVLQRCRCALKGHDRSNVSGVRGQFAMPKARDSVAATKRDWVSRDVASSAPPRADPI